MLSQLSGAEEKNCAEVAAISNSTTYICEHEAAIALRAVDAASKCLHRFMRVLRVTARVPRVQAPARSADLQVEILCDGAGGRQDFAYTFYSTPVSLALLVL